MLVRGSRRLPRVACALGQAAAWLGLTACFYHPTGSLADTTYDSGQHDPSDPSATDDPSAGTDTTTTSGQAPPAAPVLHPVKLAPPKQFEFQWDAAEGAESYTLLERSAVDDDYEPIKQDLTEQSITLTMPLHLRYGASYIVRACNGGGCTDSGPVEVLDSMAAAIGYFKASNSGPDDTFGSSVALSADGRTLVVGARGENSATAGVDGDQSDDFASDAGAVYVFVRSNGVWQQQAYLKASDPWSGDAFGSAVALSADGGTLAVGAPYEDSALVSYQTDGTAPDAGAVYVFAAKNDSWVQQAYVKASNPGADDHFGHDLALSDDGDLLVVGAPGEASSATGVGGEPADESAPDAGAVYVYSRDGNAWSQQSYLKASNTGKGDKFGFSVDVSGDGSTLAVGAPEEDSQATGVDGKQDDDSTYYAGAVYVFARAAQSWTQRAYLKASNTGEGDYFGSSVALSGDGSTLAVGAPEEDSDAKGVDGDQDDDSAERAGAVYVFVRSDDDWSQQAYLKASNTDAQDVFGFVVALSADGDLLAVGAVYEDSAAKGVAGDELDGSAPESGAVYIFDRGGQWSQRAYIKPPNPGDGDNFGVRAALNASGSTLAIAAVYEDSDDDGVGGNQHSGAAKDAGAVYLY